MKINESWKEFFDEKHAFPQFILTIIFLSAVVFSLSRFIIFVESGREWFLMTRYSIISKQLT